MAKLGKKGCAFAAMLGLAIAAVPELTVAASGGLLVPRFQEESIQAGLVNRSQDDMPAGGGVAVFDCNGDLMPEVFFTGGYNPAKLFRNVGKPGGVLAFKEVRSGLEIAGASGAYPIDIDGDDIVDVVVLRFGTVEVFKGLGDCKFERVTEKWSIKTSNDWHTAFSATWEKGNRWPTLAFGTYIEHEDNSAFPWGACRPALLLRPKSPDGGGYAEPIKLEGHCALSMLFYDWSGKGDVALRVSNDREFYRNGREQLWVLEPQGAPRQLTESDGWLPLQIWGMGIATAYLSNEGGAPEVFLTSMADNKLQQLEPGATRPTYRDIAFRTGVAASRPYVGDDLHPSTAWHAQFEDVNNDGLLDLFIVKGNVMQDMFANLDPNNLLLQTARMRFEEFGDKAGVASFKQGRGGLLVDLNMDGLLDMIVVNRMDDSEAWRQKALEEAQRKSANCIDVRLRQGRAQGNTWAVGAKVEVDAGQGVQRRELTVGGGHASGSLGWMHFGLGKATSAKLRVTWPDGQRGEWITIKAGGFSVIDREAGVQVLRVGGGT